ncbi:MAG TPA: hypothetical protein VGY13_02090 [Solirubrobacteraceae bacterium]|jgi:hypothetical protein|nr:hypothetical protein [Solirubrobacteraceae bacterium]
MRRGSRPDIRRGARACLVASIASIALLVGPAGASAASPVLEVVVPSGHSLPIGFTTQSGEVEALMVGYKPLMRCTGSDGRGKVIGPRSAIAEFTFTGCEAEASECKSEGAAAKEIRTGQIEAELVWIDQANDEVGILMNPGGGTYISFKCGGLPAEGSGPFLARVAALNEVASSFTASLSESGSMQTPTAYEGPGGEPLSAIPVGTRGSERAPTGVRATFTIDPSVPLEIKAVTAAQAAAVQRAEEAKRQGEEAAKTRQEAEATKKRQEEEAAAAATKKHLEEELAAVKRKLEEVEKLTSKSKPPSHTQLLAKALRACKKEPEKRRARCIATAHRRYGRRGAVAQRHP